MRRPLAATLLAAATLVAVSASALTGPAASAAPAATAGVGTTADRGHGSVAVRFATYNASLNRSTEGQLVRDLSTPGNAQAGAVAEVIQRTRPDVVLINEFDYDAGNVALGLFQSNYLAVSRNGSTPIDYPFAYTAPSNTGIPSGFDLNNDGTVGGPDDAYGFGVFPGQYGMAVYSRYPIIPRLRHRRTGTPLKSSPRSDCPASRTGTCRCRSAAGPCTSWSATRRRRPSTARRTATAGATTTRSGCGRTTSPRAAPTTSTTTPATAAAFGRAPSSSSPATRTPTPRTGTAPPTRSSS